MRLTIRAQKWLSSTEDKVASRELVGAQLCAFLRVALREALHAAPSFDEEGDPDLAGIRRVVPDTVYLRFALERVNA
ncbi:MAG: hypothetical protein AAF194_01655 [Pseudomonadota bacterium]